MQYANIMLALGGDRGTIVPKTSVTASEIAVLRLIHGDDAVFDVEPIAVDETKAKRTSREEIRRLTERYGKARVDGPDGNSVSVITILFPGAAAQAIKNIEDLDIPEEFFKPKSRVKVSEPEPQGTDDGLDKLTKAELLDEAEKRGVETSSSMSKADVLAALRADAGAEDEVFA